MNKKLAEAMMMNKSVISVNGKYYLVNNKYHVFCSVILGD